MYGHVIGDYRPDEIVDLTAVTVGETALPDLAVLVHAVQAGLAQGLVMGLALFLGNGDFPMIGVECPMPLGVPQVAEASVGPFDGDERTEMFKLLTGQGCVLIVSSGIWSYWPYSRGWWSGQ